MTKRIKKSTDLAVRFTVRPEDNADVARGLLTKFVRALAKANARRDRLAIDWRKLPRKRVLKPKEEE